jgi:hypothetical protein
MLRRRPAVAGRSNDLRQGRGTSVADVRIYQPSKNPLQSGTRNTRHWIVEFERDEPLVQDPLMGWAGSADTQTQVMLRFDSCEEAIRFAERNGFSYRLVAPQHRIVRPKSYAENFRS